QQGNSSWPLLRERTFLQDGVAPYQGATSGNVHEIAGILLWSMLDGVADEFCAGGARFHLMTCMLFYEGGILNDETSNFSDIDAVGATGRGAEAVSFEVTVADGYRADGEHAGEKPLLIV